MSENIIRLIPEENYTLIPAAHMIQNLRSLLDDHAITYDIHVFDSRDGKTVRVQINSGMG
ncbi:hypothetical protein [Paenibacillus sp. 22594]|uniref:hypothetical protein n=1 Tax=Paenibacillus sp. 22594 TaxID=3453947 RepID=UPI003F8609D2